MNLEAVVEGVLFYKASPIKISALAKFLNVPEEELHEALQILDARLLTGGTRLLKTDTEVQIVTAPELAEVIEALRKDDLKRDIGKAGAETLAIILYRGPVSRIEIDRIRGVNSTFIIRNLLIRGLVEKRDNPHDARSFLYAGTPELLAHLGISKREDLPEFGEIMNALDTFESEQQEEISKEPQNAFSESSV